MSTLKVLALAGCLLSGNVCFATPVKRVMHPALSPDAKTLVFSWQGDLWSASSSGGTARRLTVHPATDQFPRWTPDGSRIVFASNRYGNFDVFSIKPDGSDLKRLSFESSYEFPCAISPSGKTIYGYTNAWGRQDIFMLDINGGDIIRLTGHPLETKYTPGVSPDGATIAYCTGGSFNWRNPNAKGTYTADIWLADAGVPLRNHRNITRNEWQDQFPTFARDGSLYFVSNRSGWPNLWHMKADGSAPRQLTHHLDGTMRWPTISGNGALIAYEFESMIWTYDPRSQRSQELTFDVPDDQRLNPISESNLTSGVTNYAISPDGKRAVAVIRGELFLMPERGGPTRRLTDNTALDFQPLWLDQKRILFASARTGKRDLFTVGLDGETKPFIQDSADLMSPALSPDGKWLAFHRGMNEVDVMPASGGPLKVLSKGYWEDALQGGTSISWSPDSKWLAIDVPTDRGSNIYLREVEGARKVLVARTARGISSPPKFLPNGKGVYFTAQEAAESDLFVIDLVPPEVIFSEDELEKLDVPRAEKKIGVVEVYEPGIEDRMRRLTSTGASNPQASPDSKSIWTNVQGQLVAIPVSGGPAVPVVGVTGAATDIKIGPLNKVYFLSAGKLNTLNVEKGLATPINFSANLTINLKDEDRALFEEIWWALDRMYYDEKHNGKDWSAIRSKFSKLVPYATDRADFYALMGEMMEELNSSHLGSTPPPPEKPQNDDSTGFIGVEWNWDLLHKIGAYVVSSVLIGSPASHPQSLLLPGDRVLFVDGVAPGPDHPMAALLNEKTARKVVLKIDRAGKSMEVDIKPALPATRNALVYENWVKWERQQVDRLSKGTLAYLHIEGMNEPSHELFLRQIRTLTPGKKGVIIDVRFNGGGSTSHKALGVLIKQPWLIRTYRGAPDIRLSENINRGDSLELPSALLINQHSFSNAEMFAEGFRRLKIGPLIGVKTAGGVISTAPYSLWDGGAIRLPSRGAYTIEGENLEGNGRKADVPVPYDPNAWQGGHDIQLEAAVSELMKRIGS